MSLKGILAIEIKNDELLDIYVRYDSRFITPKIIKMEIILFLNITKIPSILSFDKYPKYETANYQIVRDSVCCEYCYKGAIEDLLDIEGIENVQGNYRCLFQKYEECEKVIISIKYNPNLISIDEMKQIEFHLNI